MKDRTDKSQLNPWLKFAEETGGQVVVEPGWFIFKTPKTKVVVPMGNQTMTLSTDWNERVGSPWGWETVTLVMIGGDGEYPITCMTVPYRSPKALTFKVYTKRESKWLSKPYVQPGDLAFDNDMRIEGKGRDIELIQQLFSHAELGNMVSRCLGRQHASSYITKKWYGYHRASNHGWAWMESTIVKHIGDETLNELRLVYQGEVEDTELLLRFHQLLTKTMESLSAIGCVSKSPIYE